ncbi:unnamed protein product [Schistosoma curassoni]|uniref:Ovule protein n=1 Tax=Schistosoma curassoni TaxID=6186 RepID=A0A183L334_9TREM|nr:unnamed protein product [Schistosoma curassoni]
MFNSFVFRNSQCFKYDEIGHIQSICHTTVHSAVTDAIICNSDPIKLDVSDDHLSLSTTSKSDIESRGGPDINETRNPCEKPVYNQSNYQIPHVIVPNMVCTNNSHISCEIPHKSEDSMLNEPSHDRKPDVALIDADFFNHSSPIW